MRWCYNVKSQKIHKQTNKQSFLIWRHAHSWWSRAYGLFLISRSSSSPHLLVPYTHATPISSKKQMKRSGSVPVKLSNSCNQYSPEVWQNSSPTMRQKRHVRPGQGIKQYASLVSDLLAKERVERREGDHEVKSLVTLSSSSFNQLPYFWGFFVRTTTLTTQITRYFYVKSRLLNQRKLKMWPKPSAWRRSKQGNFQLWFDILQGGFVAANVRFSHRTQRCHI